jgi:hypothetical protein
VVGLGSPERIAGVSWVSKPLGPAAGRTGLRVRDVVAEVAPEELPLVAGVTGFDDATVVRRLGGRCRRSDTLGFGLVVSPAAAPAVAGRPSSVGIRVLCRATAATSAE